MARVRFADQYAAANNTRQVIDANCLGGKLNRGISVIHW